MNGVWFDDLHVGYTTDFLMNYARVSTPIAKIKEIEVPGMNGVLDITESLGDVKYSNRQISFKFTTREYAKINDLINNLHGRKMKIILDRDNAYYYRGRCSVADPLPAKNLFTVEVTADCNPYRYKTRLTRHKEEIRGASNIVLLNERMRTIPVITVTGNLKMTYENCVYSLAEGNYELANVVLKQGYNRFRVEGEGSVLFQYQEGAL